MKNKTQSITKTYLMPQIKCLKGNVELPTAIIIKKRIPKSITQIHLQNKKSKLNLELVKKGDKLRKQ